MHFCFKFMCGTLCFRFLCSTAIMRGGLISSLPGFALFAFNHVMKIAICKNCIQG